MAMVRLFLKFSGNKDTTTTELTQTIFAVRYIITPNFHHKRSVGRRCEKEERKSVADYDST